MRTANAARSTAASFLKVIFEKDADDYAGLPSGHLQAGDHEEPGEVSSMQTSLHRQNARRRVRRCSLCR
jgi:hypothetical protein